MTQGNQQRANRFEDYVPVSERIEQFYNVYPQGRILTSILEHDREAGFVLVRAEVYRESESIVPAATGHAFELKGEGFVNKTSYLENCETSSVGRALALLGFEVRRGIASREEMEKTNKPSEKSQQSTQPANRSSQSISDAISSEIIGAFSKQKVSLEMLNEYLGHSLSKCTDEEISGLRRLYASLRDEKTTWAEVMPEKDTVKKYMNESTKEVPEKVNQEPQATNAEEKLVGENSEASPQSEAEQVPSWAVAKQPEASSANTQILQQESESDTPVVKIQDVKFPVVMKKASDSDACTSEQIERALIEINKLGKKLNKKLNLERTVHKLLNIEISEMNRETADCIIKLFQDWK